MQPGGQLAAYSASKAGVVALTQGIADETKGTNITTNTVLPSVIDTPANREAMGSTQADKWLKNYNLLGWLNSSVREVPIRSERGVWG